MRYVRLHPSADLTNGLLLTCSSLTVILQILALEPKASWQGSETDSAFLPPEDDAGRVGNNLGVEVEQAGHRNRKGERCL